MRRWIEAEVARLRSFVSTVDAVRYAINLSTARACGVLSRLPR
jgi:hypothetical protein